MRRIWAGLAALTLLAGCALRSGTRELGDAVILGAVGLDVQEDGVLLWACAADRGESAGVPVLGAAGSSPPDAAHRIPRAVSFSHVEHLVLGSELALRGVEPVVDYLAREPGLGPGVELWVAVQTAGELLEGAGEPGAARTLDQLQRDGTGEGCVLSCPASELMSALARQGSVLLPAVGRGDGEGTLTHEGYALLRRGALVGFVGGEEALGCELLLERGVGRVAQVPVLGAGAVSLRLERVSARVEPTTREGVLTELTVHCRLTARLVQRRGALDETLLQRACRSYEQLQQERMVRALELFQYWDADPVRLVDRAVLAAPQSGQEIRAGARRDFRALALRVEVEARVLSEGEDDG